ncbi:hypothetical protein SAMN05421837_113216 [Amycolatopsis pretoriensis]|uniref:Peptidase C51 domain-containing protein n=1 Tax=Amycolatopsis pretoriensis TaxID=218821 RepID=A0A1H5RG81_9PSEU|nr:CHAP domain-containing protein [Amycolatopsis pretoriensis]SEF37386.1 hypothetical protein SAMN05421837_113216 [Amycolatopsis pretoriensis]
MLTLAATFAFAISGTATATAAPTAGHDTQRTSMAAEFGTIPAAATASTIGDIYPAKWRNVPQDSVVDDWNMYNRECVSWAAFTIARHGESANNYGDAKYWDDNARNHGYRVDNKPTAGSIAQTDNGCYGHYLVHDVSTSSFRYIHFYN